MVCVAVVASSWTDHHCNRVKRVLDHYCDGCLCTGALLRRLFVDWALHSADVHWRRTTVPMFFDGARMRRYWLLTSDDCYLSCSWSSLNCRKQTAYAMIVRYSYAHYPATFTCIYFHTHMHFLRYDSQCIICLISSKVNIIVLFRLFTRCIRHKLFTSQCW